MTIEAAETLVANSSASLGSIGSTQRCEIPALNPASASSRIASLCASRGLGGKPLDPPAVARAAIEQPVVQAVGAPLPELDRVRHHAIAAPVRRARRVIAMAILFLQRFAFQLLPRGNPFALRGGPGGDARPERPRGEIRVGFRRADLLHRPLDAHLPLQLGPLEHEAGGGARGELPRLAALVVGVEGEGAAL